MNDTEETYIVASCKSWNRSGFDKLASHESGKWIWVDTVEGLTSALGKYQPKYIFFIHWNWRVPKEIWQKFECVCFHMTDVPYGRGGSPLQNLILAGHSDTMLSALRMNEELDAGPVYAKLPLRLNGTAQEIYVRAGEVSYKIIQWMVKTKPSSTPQQGDVTIFERRVPKESRLPEHGDQRMIYDFIRMLDADGYPKAYIDYGSMRLYFDAASLHGDDVLSSVRIVFRNGHEQ